MRKLMAIGLVLVPAMVAPSWALIGLGDLSFDGSLEVRGNSADNERDLGNSIAGGPTNDHRGSTATRVRLGMNATVTEGVTGRIEISRIPHIYGSGPTSVSTEENLLIFHNAFVTIDNLWGLKARLGRQYQGNPGDLVWYFGPKDDDSLTVTSIDGLLVQKHWDKLSIDAFTGKAVDTKGIAATIASGGTDTNLSDIQAYLTLAPQARLGLGYLIGDTTTGPLVTSAKHLRTLRVGADGGFSENVVTYRAEFFQNMGEANSGGLSAPLASGGTATHLKYEGNAFDLGLGVNPAASAVGSFGFRANYVAASGDDDLGDDKDKSFHDFSVLGVNTSSRYFGEIFGKSDTLANGGIPFGQGLNTGDVTGTAPTAGTQGAGLQVFNLGLRYKPAFAEKWTADFDYFNFRRAQGSVNSGVTGTSIDIGKDLGNEYDLTLGYQHSANVTLEGGYAILQPGDGLVEQKLNSFPLPSNAHKDDITKFFARAKIKWGGEEK